MSAQSRSECMTQDHIIALFTSSKRSNSLGCRYCDIGHFINTCIQAEHAEICDNLDECTLAKLTVEAGIRGAVSRKLKERGKLTKNARLELNELALTVELRRAEAEPILGRQK